MVYSFLGIFLFSALATAGVRTDEAENLVNRICSNPDPVMVIDTFPGGSSADRVMDLNGDGTYDVYHGELVSKIVEINGQKTLHFPIGGLVFTDQILKAIKTVANKIESGKLKVSWINFSQGYTIEFDQFRKLLKTKEDITDANIHKYAQDALEALWKTRPRLKVKELYNEFLRLQKLGVPVIVAGGNAAFREVNFYSLFPNTYTVGALDLDGKKADYSADNSLVTLWRTGSIKSYGTNLDKTGQTYLGLTLGEGERVDFHLATPRVFQSLLNGYHGLQASQVMSRIPTKIDKENNDNTTTFHELVSKLPRGLYSTLEVMSKSLATPFQQSDYIKKLGDYFYMDGIHREPLFFLKQDNDGRLLTAQGVEVQNRQYRNMLYGTSFAAPNICNKTVTPAEYAQ